MTHHINWRCNTWVFERKNSPKNNECFTKILDSKYFLFCQAVKMQLRLISLKMLSLCSGYFVINRISLRFFCQSLLSKLWSLNVLRKSCTILSKRETIFKKCFLYFYYLTSASLIIFTSKFIPIYIFLGFSYSTLWICF